MCDLPIDRAEVLRYLRMGRAGPDAELERRLARVEAAVRAAVRPRSCWSLERIAGTGERIDAMGTIASTGGRAREARALRMGRYSIGALELESEGLWKVIEGCPHAFLFCATLGAGVDALIRRTAQTSAADLLMVQAVATTMIEAYCDACEKEMAREVPGECLRMRYSPGYGDLPLETQKPFLEALDAERRTGVVLTETLLMVPSKSVSAIIGAGCARESRALRDNGVPAKHDCRLCTMRNCVYRDEATGTSLLQTERSGGDVASPGGKA